MEMRSAQIKIIFYSLKKNAKHIQFILMSIFAYACK